MDDEKKILLPEPEGHRRGALRFRNGGLQAVNMSPEELVEALQAFMTDPAAPPFLVVSDAQYGENLYLTRAAIDNIDMVCVSWVKVVAPRPRIDIAPAGAIPEIEMRRVK
jgi:hypothetical protein